MDAGADHLALFLGDLARAQVADLPGAELPDAGVADAHATPERQLEAGLLAGDEDRLAAVGLALGVRLQEGDRPAFAVAGLAADDGLEALHVQALAVAVLVDMGIEGVEHVAGPAHVDLALAPVRAELVEVLGADAAVLAGELHLHAEALVALIDLTQRAAEDDPLLGARGMQVDDVADLLAAVEVAQHRHDRRDPAAGADEEDLLRRLLGHFERALAAPQPDDRPRPGLAHEPWRDRALLDELGGDRDVAVGAPGLGGERVRTPVVHAVDDEA